MKLIKVLLILLLLTYSVPPIYAGDAGPSWELLNMKYGSGASEKDEARMDGATNSIQTLTYEHHEVHSGSHYNISAFQDVASGAEIDIIITTPDTPSWTHMVFEATVGSESSLCIFEGITAALNGTPIIPLNNNRNVTNPSDLVVSADSTITNEGTCIIASKQGSGKSTGGFIRGAQEIILKQNTKYLFRVSNDSTGTAWVSQQLTWYEHENKH